jgi:hypothetical protein
MRNTYKIKAANRGRKIQLWINHHVPQNNEILDQLNIILIRMILYHGVDGLVCYGICRGGAAMQENIQPTEHCLTLKRMYMPVPECPERPHTLQTTGLSCGNS